MRTTVVIDDDLMAAVMKATGAKTKREAVELGLKTLVSLRRQADFRRFWGELDWRGDLDTMRRD